MFTFSFFLTLFFLVFCFPFSYHTVDEDSNTVTSYSLFSLSPVDSADVVESLLALLGSGYGPTFKISNSFFFSFYSPSFNPRQFFFHIYRLLLSIKFRHCLLCGYFIIIVTITIIFAWNTNEFADDLVQQRGTLPVYEI